MHQKVGHAELWLALFFADVYVNAFAVFQDNAAVHGERDGCPLVLLNAAVIVRFEKRKVILLVQRMWFEVEARGVDVGSGNADAVFASLFADDGKNHGFSAVVQVDFVTGLVLFGGVKWDESRFFCFGYGEGYRFTLSFCRIHKCLVTFAVVVGYFRFFFGNLLAAVFTVDQKLFRQFFYICVFCFLICHVADTPFCFLPGDKILPAL